MDLYYRIRMASMYTHLHLPKATTFHKGHALWEEGVHLEKRLGRILSQSAGPTQGSGHEH